MDIINYFFSKPPSYKNVNTSMTSDLSDSDDYLYVVLFDNFPVMIVTTKEEAMKCCEKYANEYLFENNTLDQLYEMTKTINGYDITYTNRFVPVLYDSTIATFKYYKVKQFKK